MKHTVLAVLMLFTLALSAATPVEPITSAKQLKEWLYFLASDEMKGRDNGTPEMDKAAWWLVKRYKDLGLTPIPGQKDFFHHFEIKPRRGGDLIPEKNVLGWMEGSDPKLKDEFIMLSAHYDHVGVTDKVEGDQILNGADDNASGVVTMLAIIDTINKRVASGEIQRPKRSILLAAWSGEEMGLQGSRAFAKKPQISLNKMALNLNFEMLGHSSKLGKRTFFMTGEKYSNLLPFIVDLAKQQDIKWVTMPHDRPLFFASDNASFAMLEFDRENRKATGIPAHTFCSWGGESHYHMPSDNPDIIDYDNMAVLARLFADATALLADRAEIVQWIENDRITFSRPK